MWEKKSKVEYVNKIEEILFYALTYQTMQIVQVNLFQKLATPAEHVV